MNSIYPYVALHIPNSTHEEFATHEFATLEFATHESVYICIVHQRYSDTDLGDERVINKKNKTYVV